MASFLRLPTEIRLIVYNYLLVDGYNYLTDSQAGGKKKRILISTVNYTREKDGPLSRSTYRVIADRFRARSIESTYKVRNKPDLHPAILRVNSQIHAEAASVLYSQHTFDFGSDIESMVPFFRDRTSIDLASIKRIAMTKSSLSNLRDFDRCEWRNMCQFISKNMHLDELHLYFICGRPLERELNYFGGVSQTVHDNVVDHYTKTDIAFITTKSKVEGAEWIAELATITNLRKFELTTHFVVCPYPVSHAMSFWVTLSASAETGLTEYLREKMVKDESRISYHNHQHRSMTHSIESKPAAPVGRPL
ncbi:MAG: hypothetical protein MMC33_000526 [Icmadophila ericetorum]|nr:hypothetical protein [Icmadophila ericetorum]